MEIYRLGTRMFMVMEVNQLSFPAKVLAEQSNAKVAEWEALRSRFQQSLPQAKGGEKWLAMTRIFKL